MGIVQRIFYLMVPMGWLTLLAFLVIFISSILYLTKRESKWDILAYSSAEIGLVSTSLALIVGSIWAKHPLAWGEWWIWGEPRLTATLVLWFIYIAYFVVRSFTTDESRGARFAAVIGIIGFVDIPIIALATTLWKGVHPPPLIFEGGLEDPKMLLTLLVSIAAFTAFYFVLLRQRVLMKYDESEIQRLNAHNN
jgi:heme exporter protein C